MTRPGWIARRRARGGIKHRRNEVSLGYRSAFSTAYLTKKELNHHGLVLGAPGSGKTTALGLIIQGHAALGPCIVLDAKGSRSLAATVAAGGGLVWTIGGGLRLDLLDADPTVLADQLTEASRLAGTAEVFTEAAVRALQWIGYVLQWEGTPPTLQAVERLLTPGALDQALKRHGRQPRVAIWRKQIAALTDVELSGMATAMMRTTRLIDSAAGPSLGAGIDAIRLEDVVQGKTTVLLSLGGYQGLSRTVGGWSLLAMQRACLSVPKGSSALMVVDEVGALEGQARHVRRLLTIARECGVGVVLAAHGPGQLDLAVTGLAGEILQETAWQVIMAQGDPDDADRLSRLFPLERDDKQRLGKYTTGTPTVTRDDLRQLATGECIYSVRAIGDDAVYRWGRAKIAMPATAEWAPRSMPVAAEVSTQDDTVVAEDPESDLTGRVPTTTESAVEDEDTDLAELKRLVYSKVKVIDGWRVWRGNFESTGYPRQWVPKGVGGFKTGKYIPVHITIYKWEGGEIKRGDQIDHECGLLDCLDHMKAKPQPENIKNRDARARGEIPTGHAHLKVDVMQEVML